MTNEADEAFYKDGFYNLLEDALNPARRSDLAVCLRDVNADSGNTRNSRNVLGLYGDNTEKLLEFRSAA